ncbi:long chain polyunsaturated fatty acid elongation enzyme, partial [Plasmodium cynomolgi strain B]
MALNIAFINNLGENILKFFNPKLKYGRRVTKNWFLMNPTHFFIAFLLYVLFVLATYAYNAYYMSKLKSDKGLSKIKSSSSSKLKNARFDAILGKAIPLYNLLQVLLSLVITVLTIFEVRKRKFSLLHNYVDFSKTNIALCCWLFYVNKLFDFMDTILIVLRRKWNQFTFLHVYHHISVFLIMWINTSVGYDGDIYYVITVLHRALHHVPVLLPSEHEIQRPSVRQGQRDVYPNDTVPRHHHPSVLCFVFEIQLLLPHKTGRSEFLL